MEEIRLTTRDGFSLSARIFRPKNPNGKLLLINSATGVKQQMYFAFATFMANCGFVALTYDYRGIGESKPPSLKGFESSMRIWLGIYNDKNDIDIFISEFKKAINLLKGV